MDEVLIEMEWMIFESREGRFMNMVSMYDLMFVLCVKYIDDEISADEFDDIYMSDIK